MEKQLKLLNTTQCANCDDLIHQDEALVKVYYSGTTTEQEHFCGNSCHAEWYVKRLRQWGM